MSDRRKLRLLEPDLDLMRPVEWLWTNRLPLGHAALLVGEEATGKGLLLSWLCARVTRGELEGALLGKPGRIVVIGDEDGYYDTVQPRLVAAGADFENVRFLDDDDEPFAIREDGSELERLIREEQVALVWFDSLLDILEEMPNEYGAQAVRRAMRPLRLTMRRSGACGIALLHTNKSGAGSYRAALSGSHQFSALTRSGLWLRRHPEGHRILTRPKGNLTSEPPSFEFDIEEYGFDHGGHSFRVGRLANPRDGTTGPLNDLAETINALDTREPMTRAAIARAVGQHAKSGSVGRALAGLEAHGSWTQTEDGLWQRVETLPPPAREAA